MNAIERIPTPLPVPFSKAVRAGGFLFLSGQLPMDAAGQLVDGDIQVQTRVVLRAHRRDLGRKRRGHGRRGAGHRLARRPRQTSPPSTRNTGALQRRLAGALDRRGQALQGRRGRDRGAGLGRRTPLIPRSPKPGSSSAWGPAAARGSRGAPVKRRVATAHRRRRAPPADPMLRCSARATFRSMLLRAFFFAYFWISHRSAAGEAGV